MRFINGSTLQAVLPVYRGRNTPDHYIVMVRLQDQFATHVTAEMGKLTDPFWSWGNYFTGEGAAGSAMADAYRRAGILDLSTDQLLITAGQNRV